MLKAVQWRVSEATYVWGPLPAMMVRVTLTKASRVRLLALTGNQGLQITLELTGCVRER